MLSFALAILLPVTFISAATPTNQTAGCEFSNGTLNVYQHPNASSSYSIPAVVSIGSTIANSTTKTWQILNSIGDVSESTNLVDPQAQQLAQYIFLDTSSTINASSLSSPLPFGGCAFTFGNHVGKTSSDGSCGNIFGQSCLNEIMQIAQDTTAAIPPAVGSMDLIDACDTVSEAVNNYITTSSKVCSKDGPAIGVSQGKCYPRSFIGTPMAKSKPGLNFSNVDNENCLDPSTPLPIPISEKITRFEQGNYTTYDKWTKTATPLLLALFSNDTASNGSAGNYAQTYLTCTSPMNVTAGSHDPTSAADRPAVATMKRVVGFALAINALVFLML